MSNTKDEFCVSRSVGNSSYEVEGYIEHGLLRLKITREFIEDDKLGRKIQSVVFPLEILSLIKDEVSTKKKSASVSRTPSVQSSLDQVEEFVAENIGLVKKIALSKNSALKSIADNVMFDVDDCTVSIDETFSAVIRSISILCMARMPRREPIQE